MSNTIDSRVVEMRFDNQQFESNVKTSMNTLDKLKSSLRLDGVSKGLESVNDAAKKVNFNPLGDGIEVVKVKFSALQVAAITTLQNITNSAMNAGKNLVEAFTIEPVKTGFEEYETQINAVQTILANTSHNGTTLDEVNAALDELNHYADQTIYNFTEMTRNIGTFTAAGVDLRTSVDSIKGIANIAAVSGSTSQQASTAMYQLSQALAAGKVSLQDWNSVVNAGMGGKVFQDALIRTSELLKTGAKDSIETYGSFRESLSRGAWLTTEVLTETLKQFAGVYSEAELIQQGFTEEQAKDIASMANTAEEAATKVKTFTQLMDTLKEAVQSGWTQSWEIIIGDFEEAKAMWTEVSDFFGAIIQKVSDARNNVLEGAFGKTFAGLAETINGISEPINNVTKPLKEVGKSLENLDEIANRVIAGEFGNMQERWDKLTEAGYDWIDVQNKVNEKLGISYRYTKDVTDAQGKQIKSTEAQTDAQSDLNESQKNNIELLTEMSYSQLRSMGYTEKQIGALYELKTLSEKTGIPIKELIDNVDKLSGRWLALEGIKNIGKAIINVFSAIKDAWVDVFKPLNELQKASNLFDIIAGFHKLSREILEFTENSKNIDKIARTFKGLFSALDIIKKILSAGLSVAIKIVSGVLDRFGLSVLDVTAYIGDAITSFHDWLVENELITETFEKVIDAIVDTITIVKEWIDAFLEIPQVNYLIENFGSITRGVFNDLSEYFKGGIKAFLDFIDRVKQLDGLTLENVKMVVKDFCENVIGYFFDFNGHFKTLKKWLGILGKAFETFLNEKVTGPFKTALDFMIKIKDKVKELFKYIGTKIRDDVGMGEILTMLLGGSLIYSMVKLDSLISSISSLTEPFKAFGEVAEHFNGVLGAVKGAIKGFSLSIKAKAILTIAAAIAILAGSIWLLCTQTTPDEMRSAVAAISVLGLVLAGISFILSKAKFETDGGFLPAIGAIIALSAAIGILVLSMMGMDTLNPENIGRNIGIIAGFLVGLTIITIAIGKFTKFESGFISGVLVLLGIAVLIELLVNEFIKLDSIEFTNLNTTIKVLASVIVGIMGLIFVLGIAGRLCGEGSVAGAGIGLIAMAAALYLLVEAVIKIDSLKIENAEELIIKLAGMILALAALSLVLKFAGKNMLQAGIGLMAMVGALYILIGAFKIFGSMEASELEKAKKTIGEMLMIFGIVVALSNFAGENAAKAGVMLLLMAGAMLILTAVAVILSHIEEAGLKKAVKAMSQIMLIMGLVVSCTRFADGVKTGPFIAIAVTLGILMIALGALAMIEPSSLKSAVTSMSIVMGIFALILFASKYVGDSVGSLITLTIAVSMMAGMLIAMSMLDVQNAIPNAIGISLVLLAISAALKIIENTEGIAGKAIVALEIMIIVVAEIGAILWGMSALGVQDAIPNAIALSVVLLAICGACKLMQGIPITDAIMAAGSIGLFITILAGIMAGLLTVFGLISDTSFIERGMEVLAMIGYAIGDFVGSIIGGLADGVMSGLPAIGQHLTDFMTNIEGFIEGANAIDPTAMEGVKSLAGAILMLCGAELINGITSFFNALTGDNDLGAFAAKITSFGAAMKDYANSVNGVDWSGVEPSADAANRIIEVAKIIPNSGGLLGLIVGNNDIDDFGLKICTFATGLKMYAATVLNTDWSGVEPSVIAANKIVEVAKIIPNSGGLLGLIAGNNDIDEFGLKISSFATGLKNYSLKVLKVDWSGVGPSVNAAKKIVEVAQLIPNSGGLLGLIAGNNDIDEFGLKLSTFAAGLKNYARIVLDADWSGVVFSKMAATKIIEVAQLIPNSGGLVGLIAGNNDIDEFGKKLTSFAGGMVQYANKVLGIDWSGVKPSVTIASNLNEIANNLPTKQAFDGKITFKKFGEELVDFAEGFEEFTTVMSGYNIDYLSILIRNISDLAKLLNDISGYDFNGTSNFVKALNSLGIVSIDELVSAFQNGSDRVTSAVMSIINGIQYTVTNNSNRICRSFSNVIDKSASAITSSASKIISAFNNILIESITIVNSKSVAFLIAGKKLVGSLTNGINSGRFTVINAVKAMVNSTTSSISTTGFYNAGVYAVQGFADGIDDHTWEAEAKAKAMGEAALESAEEALGVASPSKEFFKIGKYVDEGFAKGISDSEDKVINSISSISEGVISNASNVITGIDEAMNKKSITSPTISPVIDMDNVNTENLKVTSMLDTIMSDPVESLSNLMANIQYGIEKSNEKVATIINGLREDINALYSDDNDKEIALYVDSKKLATSMAKPINRQLNILSRREG